MLSLVLGVALTATPNLAAPGLQCAGVVPVVCDAFLENFVANLTNRGVKVVTKNDMSEVLGVERQKQLLGCSAGDSSCLAELAGALGVGSLLSGTVAKTESGYVSTLKVIDATSGATKWAATTRVDTEKALFGFFEDQAGALAQLLAPGASRGVSPVVKWIPAMVGGVAAIVGGVLFAEAAAEAAVLRAQLANPQPLSKVLEPPDFTVEDDLSLAAENGRTFQTAGWLCVGAGAAAVVSSFLWWLLTPSSPVTATLVPSPNGALLGVALEFP